MEGDYMIVEAIAGIKEFAKEGLLAKDSVPEFAKGAKSERVSNYGEADKPLGFDWQETKDLNELGQQYTNELRDLSPFPETIKEVDVSSWEKVLPEEVAEQRLEFRNVKNSLIEEWESRTGETWPTYDHDVYSNNGIKIRSAGDFYDAHHIRPLEFGGRNTAENLTPLHAEDHYDKQGIHAPGGVFQHIGDALK